MKKILSLSFCLLLIISICVGCGSSDFRKNEGMIWNTVYHVTYKSNIDLNDSILNVMERVGKSLSVFDSTSIVSMVNHNLKTKVDNDFITVYEYSRVMNGESHGNFDPTVSPLITMWGFGPGHQASPDTLSIDSILNFTGIEKTRLENGFLIKDDIRTEFNFSAIAKGFGCDAIAEMFNNNGVEDYLIEIGGEIRTSGISPTGGKWKISIDSPSIQNEGTNHDSYIIIEITDCGVATSGNYRNFMKEGDKKYGHTISPKTGFPVQTDILSATVVAPTCMEADAAATACMVLGSKDALQMLENLNFEGLFILESGSVMTPGFENLVISKASEPGNKGRN